MAKGPTRIENECVFEIRFKPNAKLLDHRGDWAAAISQHMNLEHWQIVENRFDVFSDDKKTLLFVGHKNAGLMLTNVTNKDFFANYTRTLLTFVMGLQDFGDPIYVERIGVRNKFCTPYSGSFDQLRERYASRYINITEQARVAIGVDAKLTDIGAPLNFKDATGDFNTISGPMLQKQLIEFFGSPGEFPTVGMYYDIDYSVKPKKNLSSKDIVETISHLHAAGWDRHGRVRNLIIKG
jgi:hypothetical protein